MQCVCPVMDWKPGVQGFPGFLMLGWRTVFNTLYYGSVNP